jgi:hypothetical protein
MTNIGFGSLGLGSSSASAGLGSSRASDGSTFDLNTVSGTLGQSLQSTESQLNDFMQTMDPNNMDDILQAVLMAAATDPKEARRLKILLLKLPPDRAALGARNVIALGGYLRAKRKSLFGAVGQDPVRLLKYWSSMRDKVLQEARNGGALVWDERRRDMLFRLNALSAEALAEVNMASGRLLRQSDEKPEVIE